MKLDLRLAFMYNLNICLTPAVSVMGSYLYIQNDEE